MTEGAGDYVLALAADLVFAAVATHRMRRCGFHFRAAGILPRLVAALALAAQFAVPLGPTRAPTIVLLGLLAICTVTDSAAGYAFDAVVLPALGAIVACAFYRGIAAPSLFGGVLALGALALPFALTRGRGLGFGDVKVAACMGAACGAREGLTALGLAFVLGAVCGLVKLCLRRAARGDAVAFVPYLTTATLATVALRALA